MFRLKTNYDINKKLHTHKQTHKHTQFKYWYDVRALWPNTACPSVTAAGFTHNMLVFAVSTGVTYESFIKTGLIA